MKRLASLKSLLLRIHRSEQGAEGVEKLLIIGAIVLPLLAILILFRNVISGWVTDAWDSVRSDADTAPTGPTP
ncbi:MAG: hypothetical protein K8S99_18595 [Planctomycetes bacterium]|nr:hypothetical protein [Planctomycetota bacterium]